MLRDGLAADVGAEVLRVALFVRSHPVLAIAPAFLLAGAAAELLIAKLLERNLVDGREALELPPRRQVGRRVPVERDDLLFVCARARADLGDGAHQSAAGS